MKQVWLQVRVRRTDQPAVAPRYEVVLFTYRGGDVIPIPREVLSAGDEPVQGPVLPALVKEGGEVRARVVIFDPTIECTVQFLGWSSDEEDDPETDVDERWTQIAKLEKKKADITIEGSYPPVTLGGE